ncbi:biotin carboxyl carrier protein of acetyl coA carboxylase [Candidatus Blochmanniella vafra str. BVAF]|uniref:Biotin carboxyl carrier protein of acetyl-CoA carboxylase n=1 Tax=Blochmanniella vafra (strain BVAF) TaxID=859654 RepID=E8Q6U6_BLOVB|nr:acetyl-CoA carboxylase biotin carboxyl carrier protein [Candidatus Blochmannia vafer]ADV33693.1 biotin carboxyl carrier protein of acetyl coA carboxylase [Candidatus Blochmannia vafer str. BVAF]
MDIRKIKKLVELVEESSISKLEIIEGKKTIRIIRSEYKISSQSSLVPITTKRKTEALSSTTINKDHQHELLDTIDTYIVRSPMVGIFYTASYPHDKPFVFIGKSVEIGETLCIIEAMKVMNQIQSEKSGIIQSILIDDGKPVEFGEPLFIIKIT